MEKTYKMFIGGRFPRAGSSGSYPLHSQDGVFVGNICRGTRKDFRTAVIAARKAFGPWASMPAPLRGQLLLSVAKRLQDRCSRFVTELVQLGMDRDDAQQEVDATVERLLYYANWSDKYQYAFSTVNAVGSSYLNLTMLEPMGVVGVLAPERCGLLGLVSNMAPVIAGGNTCVVLASESLPLTAISLAEVLHAADVPPGVVNMLTGFRADLATHFASHMDVNAVIYSGEDDAVLEALQRRAAASFKRVIVRPDIGWLGDQGQSAYFIRETQEAKSAWHSVDA